MAKTKIDPNREPNLQEILFLTYYLKTWNLGKAYIMAGYKASAKSARRNAYRLFNYPYIQRYWEKILAEAEESTLIDRKKILVTLNKVAYADIKDFNKWSKGKIRAVKSPDGFVYLEGPEIDLINSEDVDGTIVQEIAFSPKDGFKIKLEPRMQAISILAKIGGMLVDKSESIVKNVDLSSLTNEQLERLSAGEPIEKVLLSGK